MSHRAYPGAVERAAESATVEAARSSSRGSGGVPRGAGSFSPLGVPSCPGPPGARPEEAQAHAPSPGTAEGTAEGGRE